MPKYYQFKVRGYYLYFTSKCVVEAMHAHASDRRLTEEGSAKFFVKADGSSVVQHKGVLNERDIRDIQEFIGSNYLEMYALWAEYSDEGFYRG